MDRQVSTTRRYDPQGPGSWKADLAAADIDTIKRLCADEWSRWGYVS
jgi:hypothetical protein